MVEEFTFSKHGTNTISGWWYVSKAPGDDLLVPTVTDLNEEPSGTSTLLDKHITNTCWDTAEHHRSVRQHTRCGMYVHTDMHAHTHRGKPDMAIIRFTVSLILLQLFSPESFPQPHIELLLVSHL